MTKQKKGLLLFLCSLVPGAGEMYMGFFKQGISIMLYSGELSDWQPYLHLVLSSCFFPLCGVTVSSMYTT